MPGPDLGAVPTGDGHCLFRVWAPFHDRVDLHLVAPEERRVALAKSDRGYHETVVGRVAPGAQYFFAFGGEERPDPASRLQPEGVHGPSEVVSRDFAWRDDGWQGIPLEDFVIYELHIGTFTERGTFDDAITHLDALRDLGITAVGRTPDLRQQVRMRQHFAGIDGQLLQQMELRRRELHQWWRPRAVPEPARRASRRQLLVGAMAPAPPR